PPVSWTKTSLPCMRPPVERRAPAARSFFLFYWSGWAGSGAAGCRAPRPGARGVGHELEEGADERQPHRPAEPGPAQVEVLQTAGEGGDPLLLAGSRGVVPGIVGEPFEGAAGGILGGAEEGAPRLSPRPPPRHLPAPP